MSGVKMPEQDAVFRKQQNEYSSETQSQPVTNGETIDEPFCPKVLSRCPYCFASHHRFFRQNSVSGLSPEGYRPVSFR